MVQFYWGQRLRCATVVGVAMRQSWKCECIGTVSYSRGHAYTMHSIAPTSQPHKRHIYSTSHKCSNFGATATSHGLSSQGSSVTRVVVVHQIKTDIVIVSIVSQYQIFYEFSSYMYYRIQKWKTVLQSTYFFLWKMRKVLMTWMIMIMTKWRWKNDSINKEKQLTLTVEVVWLRKHYSN